MVAVVTVFIAVEAEKDYGEDRLKKVCYGDPSYNLNGESGVLESFDVPEEPQTGKNGCKGEK